MHYSEYPRPWFTGETATAFTLQLRHADGSVRNDIQSATIKLIDRDTGSTIIDTIACQSWTFGLLSYTPGATDLDYAKNLPNTVRFTAQFIATPIPSAVLPTCYVYGEICDAIRGSR